MIKIFKNIRKTIKGGWGYTVGIEFLDLREALASIPTHLSRTQPAPGAITALGREGQEDQKVSVTLGWTVS